MTPQVDTRPVRSRPIAAASIELLAPRPIPRSWRVLKRTSDLVIGGVALLALSPVVAIAAIAIAVVSPGDPFFAQERVGRHGRRFKLYKLRTMIDGAHLLHEDLHAQSEVAGPVFKMCDDPRLHSLGKLLRRTSIDELPNLVNVLRGDMSLVGPRPPLVREVEFYDEFARARLRVKPGITCLWQVSGRSNVPFDEWMRLDNRYIETWTPFGDLVILAKTIPAVIRGEGAH